jgi:hypothetical protein
MGTIQKADEHGLGMNLFNVIKQTGDNIVSTWGSMRRKGKIPLDSLDQTKRSFCLLTYCPPESTQPTRSGMTGATGVSLAWKVMRGLP